MDQDRAQHIIVNARFVTQPVTGVQRFAIEICLHLKKMIPGIIFVSPRNILQTDIADQLEVKTFGKFTSHVWEQIELPLFLKQKNNPLLLNLCNTAPLFHARNIVCIHDIAFKVNPQWFSTNFVRLYEFLIPRIARRSLKVLTVSDYSKKSILEYTGIPGNKVEVVHNGIAGVFLAQYTGKFSPPYNNYLLAVSSIDPRKNLITLVKAFKRTNIKDLNLIIVGSESKVFADTGLKEEIKDYPGIKFTGYLPDEELAALYQKATMFVYPSLYEGFGIPPLEAMACGCPTIVSDTSALPDICGNASLYVNPLNIADLCNKIKLLYANPVLQQELREKGYKQISQYSWKKSAAKIIALLDSYN